MSIERFERIGGLDFRPRCFPDGDVGVDLLLGFIRLNFSANIPTREIARRLGLAPPTVRETLKRFEVSGLGWPLPEGIRESELEAALYANRRGKRGHRRHEEPDWWAGRCKDPAT